MLFCLKKDEFLFLFYTSFHHDSYVFYFRHTEGNKWSIQCTLKKFEYTRNLSSQAGVKTGAYYIFHESRNTVIIEKRDSLDSQ